MTAYAARTIERDGLSVSVEIRTYNSRYLDFVLRLPPPYRYFENKIKQFISERVCRGRIEVALLVKDVSPQESALFEVDIKKAKAYYNAFEQLRETLGIEIPLNIEIFTRNETFIKTLEPETPGEREEACIQEATSCCLEDLEAMRRQEGQSMADDLTARLNITETLVADIQGLSLDAVGHCYERLQERIAELVNNPALLDENRIAQEAAIMADKSDISEEIVRAESHIKQFRKTMESGVPCGRKLNFLLQEFNREFNTIGAKTSLSGISEKVVEAKTELEKLREQVQNIE